MVAGAGAAGCGGENRPDPESVIRETFAPGNLSPDPANGMQVTVESLGFEDRVLDSRTLTVPDDAYAAIRRALADRADGGLTSLFRDLASEGTAEVDGVESDHVSGKIDVEALIAELRNLDQSAADSATAGGIPGLADLDRLEKSLTSAEFDLYSGTGGHRLEQLDLTLAIDDPDNALPPTRIRFSLTGTE